MSWRLIFAILLITAGASAWGGLQLGDWLIAHGPEAPIAPAVVEAAPVPVLDANGKPYAATAPQPLPDGRLGVPASSPPPVDWAIITTPLIDSAPPIALATTTISMDEAIQLASMNQQDGLQGIADASALGGGPQTIQPIDITQASATPATQAPATSAGQGSWQAAFHQELAACENVGFFSRPTCSWAARNKYCEPNRAWGQVEGCPARRSGY